MTKCPKCDRTFRRPVELYWHRFKDHGVKLPDGVTIYRCEVCKYVGSNQRDFDGHRSSRAHIDLMDAESKQIHVDAEGNITFVKSADERRAAMAASGVMHHEWRDVFDRNALDTPPASPAGGGGGGAGAAPTDAELAKFAGTLPSPPRPSPGGAGAPGAPPPSGPKGGYLTTPLDDLKF